MENKPYSKQDILNKYAWTPIILLFLFINIAYFFKTCKKNNGTHLIDSK
jgi:hypothetical protein